MIYVYDLCVSLLHDCMMFIDHTRAMDKSTMSGAFDEYIYKGVRLSTFYHPRERLEAALAYTDWRQTDVVLQTFSKSGKLNDAFGEFGNFRACRVKR